MKKFTTAKKALAWLEAYDNDFTIEDLRSLKARTAINLANAEREATVEAAKTL